MNSPEDPPDAPVQTLDRIQNGLGQIDRAGRSVGSALGSAFSDLTARGRSFETVLSSLARRLSTLAVSASLREMSGTNSQPSDFVSGTNSFAAAASANLGSSEESQAGAIRAGLGAASMGQAANVTVNITTPNVESFSRSESQVSSMLARSVARGSRNA